MKTVYFLFGLPAAGKSTWITEFCKHNYVEKIISADEIKESNPDYHPKKPQELHEWSVKEAEQQFNDSVDNSDITIIFDGGGINNNYNTRLVKYAKDKGYHTGLIHIDTPVAVCLKRNQERKRVVPASAIIDKATLLRKCLEKQKLITDGYACVPYYLNETYFFDMDGTLAGYDFIPTDEYGCIDFINGEHFRFMEPVLPMINKMHDLQKSGKTISILSAAPDSICMDHKKEWLKKHCPFLLDDNIFFIGNRKYKHIMVRNMMKKYKISDRELTFVDDDHDVIKLFNEAGINCIHTSLFLANNYLSNVS